MKSRASIKAHPIHPALVPFPFAFLMGAAIFDLAALVLRAPAFSVTAAHLTIAGIAAGVLAAVPGIIDYLYSVPPGSSGEKRATRHALGNLAALALFAIAFAVRHDNWIASIATVGIQLGAAAILTYAALLGGTLVTRNMISVDHRFANAGRWQEGSFSGGPAQEIVVARAEDLSEGQMKLLRVNGTRIVLARTPSGICAADDRCSHRGASLAGGVLVGETVHCLWHGSQFDLQTGKAVCGPAHLPLRKYVVRESEGKVLLTIPLD